MADFLMFMVCWVGFCLLVVGGCIGVAFIFYTPKKGILKVTAWKNNEVVFMKTYVDETVSFRPGDKYDRVEIVS